MLILAIDPGTPESGWCTLDDGALTASGVMGNAGMRDHIRRSPADVLAIEMIASYGMPVGREVFETCVWIGRFAQVWKQPDEVEFVYRKDVKLHLCGTPRAKDPNVRQALIDMFPATGGGKTPQIGVQSKPGPLFGVSTHAWPALGVAITTHHRLSSHYRTETA
jgi:hypothetical protein